MTNRLILRLQDRHARLTHQLKACEGQLADAIGREKKRQRRACEKGCYALGSAIEAVMRVDWSVEECRYFVEFAGACFPGDNLVKSLPDFTDPEPPSAASLNRRRVRWGISAHKMIATNLLAAANLAELESTARSCLDLRSSRRALALIADARSQSGKTPKKTAAPAEQCKMIPQKTSCESDPAPLVSRLAPPVSLLILGQMVEDTMVTSVEGRRRILQMWRRILDPHFDNRYQWIGRTALDMLEPTDRLEDSWRRGAYLAWGRALHSAIYHNPRLASPLMTLAESVDDSEFRARLITAINKVPRCTSDQANT